MSRNAQTLRSGLKPQKGNDVTPQATIQGLTFFPVPEFDGLTAAFGARESAFFDWRNLPKVPREFEDMAQGLFFNGGKLPELSPKVDKKKALTALSAWLGSFAPAHEAKIATAAYALWLWTNDAALNQQDAAQPEQVKQQQPAKAKKTARGTARAERRHGKDPNAGGNATERSEGRVDHNVGRRLERSDV